MNGYFLRNLDSNHSYLVQRPVFFAVAAPAARENALVRPQDVQQAVLSTPLGSRVETAGQVGYVDRRIHREEICFAFLVIFLVFFGRG